MSDQKNSTGRFGRIVTDACLATAFTAAAVGTVATGVGLAGGVAFAVPALFFAKEALTA